MAVRDVLEAVAADAGSAEERKARNRANFPDHAKCIDDLRKLGFDPRIVWAANQNGDRIGPVPEDWDAPFREGAP